MYNRFNFYKHTFAIFNKVAAPDNFEKAQYISKHGSQYFFTTDGVYRYSNHWGRVGNCRWRLNGIDFKQQTSFWGYCPWTNFYKNNDSDALFFIENVGTDKFSYNHINNTDKANVIVRSATETARVLKKINEILTDESWAKHLLFDDYQVVQQHFIYQLIQTKKSFLQIKQEYIAIKK